MFYKRRSHSLALSIAALGVLSILVIGAFVWRSLQTPAIGVTSQLPIKEPSAPVTSSTGGSVESIYAHFRYPAGYVCLTNQPKAPGLLEYYDILRRGGQVGSNASFGITLVNVSGSFADSSAYMYRQQHPEKYVETILHLHNEALSVFTLKATDDSYEKAAFWLHGKVGAEIVLSANATDTGLDRDFQQLLESWQWQD